MSIGSVESIGRGRAREFGGVFFERTLARGCAHVTRLHPAVALARIVTFKMLEDKALI